MKDWKRTLVKKTDPVRKAVAIIDEGALQLAIVVDDGMKLQGIITDGDIRRGLLHGKTMDSLVQEVMNANPLTMPENVPAGRAMLMMKRKMLRHLPVVDGAGRVVGLHHLEELLSMGRRDNWVVLMAGGMGTRLRPLTESCPKPLLEVGGKPIISTIIESFLESGFDKFFVSVNYQAEKIEKYVSETFDDYAEVRFIREPLKMGTAGALSLLPETPEAPFFVMNSDLLTNVNYGDIMKSHLASGAFATMCIREYSIEIPYGVVNANGGMVKTIEEKPTHGFFINCGIYILEPGALQFLKPGDPRDMTELMLMLLDAEKRISAFQISDYWLDIGHHSEFTRANVEYQRYFMDENERD